MPFVLNSSLAQLYLLCSTIADIALCETAAEIESSLEDAALFNDAMEDWQAV